jgi:tetratricopeptide (TPR) repeat protein
MQRHYDNGANNRQGVVRRFRRGVVACALLLVTTASVVAQESGERSNDVRERAVAAMQENRLEDAVPLLDVVVSRRPTDVEAIRMYAVALEQTGRPGRAEEVLRAAIDRSGLNARQRARLAFDLAALLGRQEREEDAVSMYTASLDYDGAMAPAYLNRANTRVSTGEYEAAISDYERYLALRPNASQRPEIEEMIALLEDTVEQERIAREEEERRRREEEERRRREEEERRRREEEERRLAEERRQEMLDSVLQSLGNAEEDAESFEVENEDIQSVEEELDIVE